MNKLIVILLIIIPLWSHAQSKADWAMWNSINISYSLTKKYNFLFSEEVRLKTNISELNLINTNIGIEREFNHGFKTALIYRFIQKYQEEETTISFRNRLMWDTSFRKKVKKSSFSYRSRLQAEVKNYFTTKNGEKIEWFWRNKFGYKYELNKKFAAEFSTEFRYQIDDPRSVKYNHQWNRNRYQLGLNYKINKLKSLSVYYLFQDEHGKKNNEDLNIVGLEFNVEL